MWVVRSHVTDMFGRSTAWNILWFQMTPLRTLGSLIP